MITPMTSQYIPGDLVRYRSAQRWPLMLEHAGSVPLSTLTGLKPGHQWVMQLCDIDAIDPKTHTLTFAAFNNVDYDKWDTGAYADFSAEPIARDQLQVDTCGIIVRDVKLVYEGLYAETENEEKNKHFYVTLINQRLYLLEAAELELVQTNA